MFRALQTWINACFASSLLQGNRHLCRWRVHEKWFIDPTIAISDMKRAVSFHFELLFTVTCLTWLTEDLLKNDSPSKVRLWNSAAPKTACSSKSAKTKKIFTFPRMRRQESRLLQIYGFTSGIGGINHAWCLENTRKACKSRAVKRVIYRLFFSQHPKLISQAQLTPSSTDCGKHPKKGLKLS